MRPLLALVLGALLLTGCSNDEASETTLTLTGTVNLCDQSARNCQTLPASGAEFRVFLGQKEVETGVLEQDGSIELTVEPGRYSAALAWPELNLQSARAATLTVDAGEGDAAELDILVADVTFAVRGNAPRR